MSESYRHLGDNFGWKLPAFLAILIALCFLIQRLRKRKNPIPAGLVAYWMVITLFWAVNLPSIWGMYGAFPLLMFSNPAYLNRRHPKDWLSRFIESSYPFFVPCFAVWFFFITKGSIEFSDSMVFVDHKPEEQLQRDRIIVKESPHDGVYNSPDTVWTLEGRHGVRMTWNGSDVYWGPHGLTNGNQLGHRLQLWAATYPSSVAKPLASN